MTRIVEYRTLTIDLTIAEKGDEKFGSPVKVAAQTLLVPLPVSHDLLMEQLRESIEALVRQVEILRGTVVEPVGAKP